jgi:hypothetical protein
LVGRLERDHLGDLGIYGRIILKWILQNQDRRAGTGFIWLRIEISLGLL